MPRVILSAVAITAIAGALFLALMHYGSTGPADPNMVVRCKSVAEGMPIPPSQQDCTMIAKTLAQDANASKEKTKGPLRATVVALGATVPSDIALKPVPNEITQKVPQLAQHRYFIEGNSIAFAEPQSRRVVLEVEIQQSQTP